MKTIAKMAALGTLALWASASAATQVALLTPVTFDPRTDKRIEVREECRLGELLETRIGDALRRTYKGTGTTTSLQGDVLKVNVTTIWGARGNNWTGPKGLALDATLMHDGVVERTTSLHRTTMGGFWGAFKGICGFMERDVTSISKDVARWAHDPAAKGSDPDSGEIPPNETAQAPAGAASSTEN